MRLTAMPGCLLLVMVTCWSARLGAAESDWPQFKRDSQRSGNAPNAVLSPPLQRVCAVRFPAPIHASPAVVGGRVFIQDVDGHVACIDYRNSRVVWKQDLGGINNTSSPAVSNGRVFVGSTLGFLAILDAATGRIIAKVPAKGGVITAPAVTPHGIYFSTLDGTLVKIDKSGKVIWAFTEGRASLVEFAVRGKEILFPCGGTKNWKRDSRLLLITDEGTRPVVKELGIIRCPTGGPVFGPGGTYAFQAFDSEEGFFYVKKMDAKIPYWGGVRIPYRDLNVTNTRVTPSVRGNNIYRGDLCFDAAGRVLWRADRKFLYRGGFHSSPALSRNHMILGTEDGRLHFFSLKPAGRGRPAERKPVWSYVTEQADKPNSAITSSPAVVGGRVFFGGEDGLLYVLGRGSAGRVIDSGFKPRKRAAAINRSSDPREWRTPGGDMGYSMVAPPSALKPPLRIKWRTRTWDTFKGPVIVADGKVFSSGRLGQVAALDAETGRILWRVRHKDVESCPSPTYAQGKLLIMRGALDQQADENLYGGIWCHDAKTGKELWRKKLPLAFHYNPDGVVVHKDKVLVAYNAGGGAVEGVALDLATGREKWKRKYPGIFDAKTSWPVRTCGVIGDGRWFLSVAGGAKPRKGHWGAWDLKDPVGKATLAINPDTGQLLWQNKKHAIAKSTRIAYRKGTLVVFAREKAHALNPANGQLLWSGAGSRPGRLYYDTYFQQALSDEYLSSRGTKGIQLTNICAYYVFANGFWYGHARHQGPVLCARKDNKVVWQYRFLSRACPAPTPAYGRLYYAPNGEGVVYCFEPGKK